MNWQRGFKRLWYAILALIWVLAIGTASLEGAFRVGETVAYLLIFSLVWLVLGGGIVWVANGFRKDPPQP